jgi:6-pyruvoyl-tetrahydropterin synthase
MQLFVNALTVLDFSFLCQQRGMVGESWQVDVVLSGDLDHQSMILDFGDVKRTIKTWIDTHIDHRLLVASTPSFNIQPTPEGLSVLAATQQGQFYINGPEQGFALIAESQIDTQSVSAHIKAKLLEILPKNIVDLTIKLKAETNQAPFYHYSHGLKKHLGNCQRIAHGHRSRIEIYVNQQWSTSWAEYWSKRWADIYLGSRDDQIDLHQLNLPNEFQGDEQTHKAFQYRAKQGCFEMVAPTRKCEIIPHDTTVELLAQYIAHQTASMESSNTITVYAYEGIEKGAIYHA